MSCNCVFVIQLVAQVLDEFDDEDIGVGLLDAKLDKVVAKKLGKKSTEQTQPRTQQSRFCLHLSMRLAPKTSNGK